MPVFLPAPTGDRERLWPGRVLRWVTNLLFTGGLLAAAIWLVGVVGEHPPDRSKLTSQDVPGSGAQPVEVLEEGDDYRVIRHAAGVTRVPARPQRICALAAADELLSIGVKPVAHSINDGNFPDYLAEPLADVPWVPCVYGASLPNMEAVVRVHPDLIITRTTHRQTYEQLSKIAPVVVVLDHLVYYRERLLDVGTIVGRRREAEARLAWFNAKVDAANAVIHPIVGQQTMALMRIRPRAYRLMGDQSHDSPLLYGDLKMIRPDLVSHRSWASTTSPEQLLKLDADYLLIAVETSGEAERTYAELEHHPFWQRVPAVRSGRVSILRKSRHWSDSGILGRARGIDDVVRLVAPEKVDEVNAKADAVYRETMP